MDLQSENSCICHFLPVMQHQSWNRTSDLFAPASTPYVAHQLMDYFKSEIQCTAYTAKFPKVWDITTSKSKQANFSQEEMTLNGIDVCQLTYSGASKTVPKKLSLVKFKKWLSFWKNQVFCDFGSRFFCFQRFFYLPNKSDLSHF